MIAVVDAGMGNAAAVVNMLEHVGADVRVARTAGDLDGAGRIVLPGAGAFDRGMELLEASGLRRGLDAAVARGMPVLGICLGFQLMGRRSAEGRRPGLGWMEAETRAFDPAAIAGLRLPHVGWEEVRPVGADPLFAGGGRRFYFVHSYHVVCDRDADVAATCAYGGGFTAAACRGALVGVQFHPEKSHRHGMELLRRFAGLGP